ncbi:glycosyltransferase [Robertkochia solimangrovi]|uniref:glycosyltransferase n=1 Tax=Robertkochia solimangrovi TaxID=2213046 RepID=UPI00117DCF2C|nr:glycosyltransferase [Robertkochia solimangrovi]TRZ44998.1 hypothetical protein DMZ48_04345 [Robertkochia solimangrovi]
MENKAEILVFIDWFLPGYKAGGPIQSVKNLIDLLKKDYNFYLVTSNKDEGETLAYEGIIPGIWYEKEGYWIQYLDDSMQHVSYFKKLISEHDFENIYINSMFSPGFSIKPLYAAISTNKSVILAPRGMLGAGALEIKSFKKMVYLSAFKALGWHKKLVWHATADTEYHEIQKIFGKVHTHIISNVSAASQDYLSKIKVKNDLNLFFLSRISFKKNLLDAIGYLKYIPESYSVKFTIIGPIEESEYWKSCKTQIEQLPAHIRCNFIGPVANDRIASLLHEQHVLLLPTRSENYGHVIVESWQNGCPVIISDQTPWKNLHEHKLGYELPLIKGRKFIKAIINFAGMKQQEFNEWSHSSYNYSISLSDKNTIKSKYKNLFKDKL